MSFIAFTFFGSSIFQALGYAQPPQFWTQIQENQLQAFLGLFLFSSVAQNMQATGAFEIILDGEVLFSKLEQGRMPSLQEIEEALANAGVEKTRP